jgi:hypothetical protein
MKRRQFFERLSFASAAAVSTPILSGSLTAADQEHEHGHGHDASSLSGELSNATVSFGEWQSKDDEATWRRRTRNWRPSDVASAITRPTTGTPAGGPLINDPVGRVYAGLNPSAQDRDRVEVVEFPSPGRHLVICGVQGHFLEGMFGYVRALRRRR